MPPLRASPPPTARNCGFIYLVVLIGTLGGLLFGYDTGVIAGALIFINHNFTMTIFQQELVVSSLVLGATLGSICSGKLADCYGRRRMLIAAALIFMISTAITTSATDPDQLIVGRVLTGLAIGISSYVTPLFIAEMAPASMRGALVLLNAITITGGEAVAFLVSYFFAAHQAWRLMFAVGLLPAALLFLGMLLIPETPRWLVLKGLPLRAEQTLQKIRARQDVDQELHSIQQSFSLAQENWRRLFSAKVRPVLIIAVMLGIFQQFFGINTIMYYGPVIFKTAGFQGAQAQILATFGMGIVNMLMSAVCVYLVERVGRRRLLILGSLVAALSLMCVGYTFRYASSSNFMRWFGVISLVIYVAGYCISVGSLFWLLIAEIFPLSVRGLGMSIATAVQWGANFLVSVSFLTILGTFGPSNTFWLYSLMCLLCFIFCYFYVPETQGVSLEQIERNLEAGKPAHQLGLPVKLLRFRR